MNTTLSPYLCVSDTRAAIDFYEKAFGSTIVHQVIEEMPHDEMQRRCDELFAATRDS